MNKTNWAFVGTGMIASSIAALIQNSEGHTIQTVYNRTFEKAEKLAESVGAKACHTLKEAVLASNIEMVYIAVTAESHYEMAKACIELGKPVLLEKPFCISRAEAELLFAFAKEKGVYIAEGMWSWYNPVNLKTKEWIKEGKIGRIRSARLSYCAPVLDAFPRLRDPARAGGALMDNGIYPLSFCYHLFGKPERVYCTGSLENGVDLEELVTLEYDDFSAVCDISLLKEMESDLTIEGELGTITTNMYHAAAETVLTYKDGTAENFKGYGMFDVEFTVTAKEVSEGHKTGQMVPAEATLNVLGIMDECRKQMNLVFPFEQK